MVEEVEVIIVVIWFFGVRTLLEFKKSFILLKMDLANDFDTFSRAFRYRNTGVNQGPGVQRKVRDSWVNLWEIISATVHTDQRQNWAM